MNFVEYISRHIRWSIKTFGPGKRTNGVVAHIRKELMEVEADPEDIFEWADIIVLALDGAWRSGFTAEEIIDALQKKQDKNIARKWPDWRKFTEDQPIEHVRD